MLNDDLLFLLVFVILPTAVVVSGFWLFVVVRRQPTRIVRVEREQTGPDDATLAVSQVTSPPHAEETLVHIATIDSELLQERGSATPEPAPESPLPADEFDDERQAVEDVSPLAADLLYSEPEEIPASGDTQTFATLPDPPELETEHAGEAHPTQRGQTEEIPTVGNPLAPSEEEPETSDDASARHAEPTVAPKQGTDELKAANWEISDDELTANSDTEESASDEAPQQAVDGEDDDNDDETGERDEAEERSGEDRRRPERRLIPGQHAERTTRRGRHPRRRAPRFPRLRRDEGGM